jgi:hypothetical protein
MDNPAFDFDLVGYFYFPPFWLHIVDMFSFAFLKLSPRTILSSSYLRTIIISICFVVFTAWFSRAQDLMPMLSFQRYFHFQGRLLHHHRTMYFTTCPRSPHGTFSSYLPAPLSPFCTLISAFTHVHALISQHTKVHLCKTLQFQYIGRCINVN